MASNVVQVSIGEARRSNQELQNNLNELNRMVDTLMRTVQQTDDWWEGDTTKAFIASFEAGTTVFKKYLEKISQHGTNMVNSVQRQHDLDQRMAGAIRRY